jgi:hypothetical protein
VSIELEIVRDISGRLDRAGFAFMLTGSMAMNAYAEPRMTRDIDVVIELNGPDTDRLVASFSPDYISDHGAIMRAIEHESMFNLIHSEYVFKVDCIVRKDSDFRRLEFSRRNKGNLGGVETWLVSKEDPILSKLSWGASSNSEYQARDIRNLLKSGCDMGYIHHWAPKLGVLDYLIETQRD